MPPQETSPIPANNAYGILHGDTWDDALLLAADQIRRLGYAIVDSGFSSTEITDIEQKFDMTRAEYTRTWGEDHLESMDEHNSMRLPMAVSPEPFRNLAFAPNILSVVGQLIDGQFILNQQNGVINPAGAAYNQGLWHRDLPYQHFVTNVPLAVNALYCVDDFTSENGGTWVIPASHKTPNYPSDAYVSAHALQVNAKAGQYIVLDCMAYHTGGFNRSTADRRAVNHVYTIPYFSQQIRIPGNVEESGLTPDQRRILGFDFPSPQSVDAYLSARARK
ncbi:Phytanoyl-CoA dioxygenase (PhyH) [Jannaschia faecimaris]|uniref:Phytanoyl-CoA dioxygenase (PhyH) n=1 Tax=Jannaschia faecimaris TaxID=1244108 RepID=A0A1H3JNW5_9RHOB|nr:phytanoyl-CoA dioxygenase family protein [Jannaschia faecimaris]SDY41622.1 Phytanoyl-CoA dioxygenase (PhyH) [Jannaschia faecimaris]